MTFFSFVNEPDFLLVHVDDTFEEAETWLHKELRIVYGSNPIGDHNKELCYGLIWDVTGIDRKDYFNLPETHPANRYTIKDSKLVKIISELCS